MGLWCLLSMNVEDIRWGYYFGGGIFDGGCVDCFFCV